MTKERGTQARLAMDRHRRVWGVWNWLPAFRAAAEYESLQRAALAVSLSPSALSRSITLLEGALGVPLFLRSPKGLKLTARGRALLVATRDAVRLVDEALPTSQGGQRLRGGAAGPVLPLVLAEAVGGALPRWTATIDAVDDATIIESLRCGDLDFALTHQPHVDEGIVVRQLPSIELVLAGPVGDRRRAVSLQTPGYFDGQAQLTVSTWSSAERLADKLGLPLVGPGCLVRGRAPLLPLERSLPVFAAWRQPIVAGQALPMEKVAAAAARFISGQKRKPRDTTGKATALAR